MKALTIPAPAMGAKARHSRSLTASAARRIAVAVATVSTLAAWGAAMYLEIHDSAAARAVLAASALTGTAAAFALVAMQEGGAQ